MKTGRARFVATLLLLLLPSPSVASEGNVQMGPMRLGIPGLFQTVTRLHGGAPLRFGLYAEHGIIDDGHGFDDPSFLPTLTTEDFRLQMALQWKERIAVAAALPFRRYAAAEGGRIPAFSADGWSDLQLSASAELVSLLHEVWDMGLWGSVRFPTGEEEKGLSTGVTEGEVGLRSSISLFEDSVKPVTHFTVNVGYRFNRNEANGYGVLAPEYASVDSTGIFPPSYPALGVDDPASANDQLLLRAALEVRRQWARIFLEYSVDWLAWSPIASYRESPSWITPGVSLGSEGSLTFQAAWAIGLWTDDAHTPFTPKLPEWMVSVGLSYPFFLGTRDRDGDGVKDRQDRCPDLPEDRDGFQDGDGCPDWDNDHDGIPDRKDLCPTEAEDRDGFEDQDGCPDWDNDRDGIVDTEDRCPDRPEDFNGIADGDGCPDGVIDSDGDGIIDERDICPHEAEDFDGFEDADGCPDPDNDLDGIADVDDACPLQAEDYNGIDDDDGCPDGKTAPDGAIQQGGGPASGAGTESGGKAATGEKERSGAAQGSEGSGGRHREADAPG